MIQLLKLMIAFFSLKKHAKPKTAETLISFNIEDLSKKMHQYSIEVFRCRTEDSMNVLKRIVETARNIQILEVNRAKEDRMQHHLGRLEALTDLANFIETSLDPVVYASKVEKQEPKVKVLARKTNNQAVI